MFVCYERQYMCIIYWTEFGMTRIPPPVEMPHNYYVKKLGGIVIIGVCLWLRLSVCAQDRCK